MYGFDDPVAIKYEEDERVGNDLRWRPTPPRMQAIIDRLRQEPPIERTEKLTGLDRAVQGRGV